MPNFKRSKVNGLLVGENAYSKSCDVICTVSKEVIEPHIVGISIDPITIAEGQEITPVVRVTLSDGSTRVAHPDEYILTSTPSYKVEVLGDHDLWGKEPGMATVTATTAVVNPTVSDTQEITVSPPVVIGLRFQPDQITVPFSIGGTTAHTSLEKQMSTGNWVLANVAEANLSVVPGSDLTLLLDGSASVSFETDQVGGGGIVANKHGFSATLNVNIT